MKLYKIRRKSDGLFSTGGLAPGFTKAGKTWSNIGQLKNHLRLFDHYNYPKPDHYTIPSCYKNCEILVVEYVVIETMTMDLNGAVN